MSSSLGKDWLTMSDALENFTKYRMSLNPNKLCDYGIKCLDDALHKIMPNDLIAIGADSGVGKSDLGLLIAGHNAKKGRKVGVFYLEGKHEEAIKRLLWREVCDIYYKERRENDDYIDMNYKKWATNSLPRDMIIELKKKAYLKFLEEYNDNMVFYNVTDGLTLEKFTESLFEHQKEVVYEEGVIKNLYDLDLIIIDHLQYFSLTQNENEYSQITAILRAVKNITDNSKVPIILISHLRKKSKDRGLPDQEDFFGSSNIPKIASEAIVLANATSGENYNNGIYPTYIRFVKSRSELKAGMAIMVDFIAKERRYADEYKVYKVTHQGHILEPQLEFDALPHWAKQGTTNQYTKYRERSYTDI